MIPQNRGSWIKSGVGDLGEQFIHSPIHGTKGSPHLLSDVYTAFAKLILQSPLSGKTLRQTSYNPKHLFTATTESCTNFSVSNSKGSENPLAPQRYVSSRIKLQANQVPLVGEFKAQNKLPQMSGAPSGSVNSSLSATGCQNRRKYCPIGWSALVRVNRSFSAALSIFSLPR